MPPIDPDNEQFVIYVRSKKGFKAWYPLNVVTGGSTANTLVKGLESNLSKDLALTSLTNNIGQAIYKDIEQLEQADEVGVVLFVKDNEASIYPIISCVSFYINGIYMSPWFIRCLE